MPLTIEEWDLNDAHHLHSLWTDATALASFCYNVDVNTFATGILPDEDDDESFATDNEQKLIVAHQASKPIGFAHIGAGVTECNDKDITCGIIRFLAFKPTDTAVGQKLLEHVEHIFTHDGYKHIDAFPLYHGYAFHNHKVGILSNRLDHITTLLKTNGYQPHDTHLTLEHPTLITTPPTPHPDIETRVEKTTGIGTRPNIRINAFDGEDRVGTCRSISGRTYANITPLDTCCYTRWLGVSESHQQRGIGRHLLTHALYEMHTEDYTRAVLNCREKNTKALSLYQTTGYKITDTSSAYIKNI